MLNLDYKAERIKKENFVGEGAYGKIKIQSFDKKQFIVKRQYFRYKANLQYLNVMMTANKY